MTEKIAGAEKLETVINTTTEFEVLVKANMKRAYFTALGILGSHDAAMEISQEAFIKAYKHFNKFDRNKKFFTWYYRILKNLCLNTIRNEKRRQKEDFLEYENSKLVAENVIDEYEKNETLRKLQEVLLKLDFEDREIIVLKVFEGLSYKEIAEILNIPVGSAMSRLFYARKKLAGKLKGVM